MLTAAGSWWSASCCLATGERREPPWRAQTPELAVLDVEEHALGWLVFRHSVEYIRSRDPGKMLVGHGLYLVDRQDGSIHHITPDASHQHAGGPAR